MLGWSVTMTTLLILVPAVIYTMLGGVQAVTWTDVKTMGLTVVALVIAMVFLVMGLPDGVGVDDALTIAGGTGRLQAFDFDFTLTETYTFWSGMIGGLFLMLSYFGCDQSQVQRYLTAKSVDDGRTSLLMSAYWKIPLQVLVLLVGVFTFLFYLFNQPPLLFNPVHDERVRASAAAPAYEALQREFEAAFAGAAPGGHGDRGGARCRRRAGAGAGHRRVQSAGCRLCVRSGRARRRWCKRRRAMTLATTT